MIEQDETSRRKSKSTRISRCATKFQVSETRRPNRDKEGKRRAPGAVTTNNDADQTFIIGWGSAGATMPGHSWRRSDVRIRLSEWASKKFTRLRSRDFFVIEEKCRTIYRDHVPYVSRNGRFSLQVRSCLESTYGQFVTRNQLLLIWT